jgi:hypothetical protein
MLMGTQPRDVLGNDEIVAAMGLQQNQFHGGVS